MWLIEIIGMEIILGSVILTVIITNYTLGIPNDYLGCMLLLVISLGVRSWSLHFARVEIEHYKLIEQYKLWDNHDDER